jgi:CheY-like chemotaxis protein
MLGLHSSGRSGKHADRGDILPFPHFCGEGRTVLVIDDEVALLAIISDVLEESGFAVLTATDGPAGVDILLSEQPIDLLITDIRLPKGMNGREVAAAARRARPQLKVLLMTGYAGTALDGFKPLGWGMELMTKPFDLISLPDRVQRFIED